MNPRNVWTIARRDFRSYFTSPIAYIVIAGFLFIIGWMFFFNLSHFSQSSAMGRGGGSITEGIIRPLFGNMNVILLFLTPFITMRLFAEERKNHTLELLITSPASLTEIILGKFFSSFLLISVMLAFTLVYPIVLVVTGNPDLGPIFTSYVGTLFLASCYLAIGVLFSSVTENQIVAGALTFAAGLFFWLVSWATQSAGPVWGEILTHLSLISHYNNFSQGMINTVDVVYYISFVFTGLFLTHRVLDSYRWR
jgi:ABC-2 type transport system permease protein